jgi:hypothetical protein
VNLTVIWPFLLGARELTHILLRRGRNYNIIMLKIIRVTIDNLVAQDLYTSVVVYMLLVCDASFSD